jgi:hypothetical protein
VNYVLLAIGVLGIYPLALVARRVHWIPVVLAGLIGLLPFLGFDALTIDFFEQLYRGESRSLEIAVLDLCAAALFFALPKARDPAPYRASRYTYLFFAVFSITAAAVPLYTAFSLVKLVRAYFLLGVVTRLAEYPRLASALGRGLALGVVYSAGMALEQRYVDHMFQVTGGFEHANTLGMAVNLVAPIALAVLFEGKGDKLGVATVGSAAICVVLALSRGALLMFGFAGAIVVLGSLVRHFSRRKLWVTIVLVVAVLAVLGKSFDSIVERFLTAPEASVAARDRFEAAAQAMVSDNVFGIGLNQYSHVLEHGGYADRFEMPDVDRDGLAHHIYWLTAAELGWHGLLAYLWLIAMPLFTAVRGALRFKGDVRGDILLGCAAGMAAMHVHGLAEWIARQTSMMYLFFTVVGLTVAMSRAAERSRNA